MKSGILGLFFVELEFDSTTDFLPRDAGLFFGNVSLVAAFEFFTPFRIRRTPGRCRRYLDLVRFEHSFRSIPLVGLATDLLPRNALDGPGNQFSGTPPDLNFPIGMQ